MPTLTNSKNLGTGFSVPYYWAIAKDKDLTFTPKLYASENPLLLAEYRQAFKNSYLIIDSGHTSGYRQTTAKKSPGSKSHFFSRFEMNFNEGKNETNKLEINLQ